MSKSAFIRNQIVIHVSNNWQRFNYFTQQASGKPYGTKRLYFEDTSKPYTQESLCEVKATTELFPYQFQVYQDGCLRATFGEALDGINRFRLTGNYNNSHYNVSVPLFEPILLNHQTILIEILKHRPKM
ncbi:hypothetical protein KGM_200713 [Danaus plexippus plexippus]|uniref:Uncharacterized protein n=1 Tax=Danaus plexippus plexippus TaxID=278856 RepID=A0A212ERR3_DANPL|nr:hypothetical protein KGM_200713 [Danaus plexippus plexippus]